MYWFLWRWRQTCLTKHGAEYDGGNSGRLERLGLAPPDDHGGGGFGGVVQGLAALVDVLGEPAEALAVALPLQHTAHENLQWSCVELLHGNVALRGKNKKQVTLKTN